MPSAHKKIDVLEYSEGIPLLLTTKETQAILGIDNRPSLWRLQNYLHRLVLPKSESRFFAPYILEIQNKMAESPEMNRKALLGSMAVSHAASVLFNEGNRQLHDALQTATKDGYIRVTRASSVLNVNPETIRKEWGLSNLVKVERSGNFPYLSLSSFQQAAAIHIPGQGADVVPNVQSTDLEELSEQGWRTD